MVQQLRISDALTLPLNAVTEKLAFLGRTGGGKTYAAMKLAEEMLEAEAHIVALDPVGKWHGLRLLKDGMRKGYPIPVFGGLYGDVPLEPTAGSLIADLIVDKKINAVIDVSQFILSEQTRFAFDFATRLFQRQKAAPSALHLFIEECQEFIPQNLSGTAKEFEGRMLHAYERLWKLGRNAGIGGSLISQRPQEVNKKVLNMTECMFVFQMTGPQEKKTVKEWIGEKGLDQSLVDTLPYLKQGDCHIWSPVWLQKSEVIHIAEKRTFDASATPEVGARIVTPKELSPIDVELIREAMAATIEKAKAEDPKELRKQVAELKKQLAAKASAPAKPIETIKTVEKPILQDAQIKRLESFGERLSLVGTQLIEAAREITASLSKLSTNGHKPMAPTRAPIPNATRVTRQSPIVTREPIRIDSAGVVLPIGEQKILSALIQFPNGLERNQLTVLTGYKRSTRDAYIQRLGEKGFVNVAGKVFASDQGRAALPECEALPTGEALQEYWKGKLPEGEWSILNHLLQAWPEALDRKSLTEVTGYKRSTRDAYIQRLASKELVVPGRSNVKASDNLFME